MLVHRRVTLNSKFAGFHLFIWVRRGTVRVKYLAQEHSAVPQTELKPRLHDREPSALNHKATAPPMYQTQFLLIDIQLYFNNRCMTCKTNQLCVTMLLLLLLFSICRIPLVSQVGTVWTHFGGTSASFSGSLIKK